MLIIYKIKLKYLGLFLCRLVYLKVTSLVVSRFSCLVYKLECLYRIKG